MCVCVFFFVFFFFFSVAVLFCFFFALNSASTNEDIGRACASAIFALNQKKIILNSLENVEDAHSHSDPVLFIKGLHRNIGVMVAGTQGSL